MLRRGRAKRLKTFGILSAIAAVTVTTTCVVFWHAWQLDMIATGMGIHGEPVLFGLIASLVPIYFVAMEVWLPLMPPRAAGIPKPQKPPLTEDEMHWRLMMVVYLICILFTELLVGYLPVHHAALATTRPPIH